MPGGDISTPARVLQADLVTRCERERREHRNPFRFDRTRFGPIHARDTRLSFLATLLRELWRFDLLRILLRFLDFNFARLALAPLQERDSIL